MSAVSADIQKYEVGADGSIHYFIKVMYNGREWAVRKRYSDFSKLDEYLLKDGYNLSYALPSKQFWYRMDKKALLERQKGLQSYLNILLTSTLSADHSLVKEFLDVDHNKLEQARKLSFHQLKRTERMESLVSIMSRLVIYMPVKKVNPMYIATPVTRSHNSHSYSPPPSPHHHVPLHPNTVAGTAGSSGHGGHHQFPSGPSMQKSKSLSFSAKFSFSSQNGRKNSFQPEPRGSFALERKYSLDFAPSSHNRSSSVNVTTLKDLLKKEAYEYGVSALWSIYESEINQLLEDADLVPRPASTVISSETTKDTSLPTPFYKRSGAAASRSIDGTPQSKSTDMKAHVSNICAALSKPVRKYGADDVEKVCDAVYPPKSEEDYFEGDHCAGNHLVSQEKEYEEYQKTYQILVSLVD
jgi:hypothetical protein